MIQPNYTNSSQAYQQKLKELKACKRWNLCVTQKGELFKASAFRVVIEKIKGLWICRLIFNSQDGTKSKALKKGIAKFIQIGNDNKWIDSNKIYIINHLASIVNIQKDSKSEKVIRDFINAQQNNEINVNQINQNKNLSPKLNIYGFKLNELVQKNLNKILSEKFPPGNYFCFQFVTERSPSLEKMQQFIENKKNDNGYNPNLTINIVYIIFNGVNINAFSKENSKENSKGNSLNEYCRIFFTKPIDQDTLVHVKTRINGKDVFK